MAKLSSNGAEIAYEDVGEGGPPFVFVHGLACDHHAFAPQVADLSRDHRCVSVDLRGRGASSAVPPFNIETAVADVAAVCEALQLGPAILVGHSLGGITALVLQQRWPSLVAGIVAIDSPIAPSTRLGALAERIEAGGAGLMAGLVEGFFTGNSGADVRDYVARTMLTCPPEVTAGMLADAPAVFARMLDLVRAADRKPFMTIWADRPSGDPSWLRDVTMFARQEPIAGAGHFVQLEQPAIVNALLRAFLDDVARDPRS